jgi:hypothetical protein
MTAHRCDASTAAKHSRKQSFHSSSAHHTSLDPLDQVAVKFVIKMRDLRRR